MRRSKTELAVLREIGLTIWDPIGLAAMNSPDPIDTYDPYLSGALNKLQQGLPDRDVATWLMSVEVRDIGLGLRGDTQARAHATIAAIRARLLPSRSRG